MDLQTSTPNRSFSSSSFHFCSALHEICMHCYFEYKACVLHLAGWLLIIWSHKYQILLILANHNEFKDNEHLWKLGWFTYLSMNSDTRVSSDWKFFLKTLWAKDIFYLYTLLYVYNILLALVTVCLGEVGVFENSLALKKHVK